MSIDQKGEFEDSDLALSISCGHIDLFEKPHACFIRVYGNLSFMLSILLSIYLSIRSSTFPSLFLWTWICLSKYLFIYFTKSSILSPICLYIHLLEYLQWLLGGNVLSSNVCEWVCLVVRDLEYHSNLLLLTSCTVTPLYLFTCTPRLIHF